MQKAVVVIAIVILTAVVGFAQGTPSSKATAQINTSVGCSVTTAASPDAPPAMNCHDIFTGDPVPVDPVSHFATIMSRTMKVSNSQSLFVSPSLVTGLYTQTRVKSSPGSGASTATAQGGVYLRAVVTNKATGAQQIAYPVAACTPDLLGCYQDADGAYGVVLDSRVQTLTQEISACIVSVVVGGVAGSGTCTFDLTTELLLKTTSAHTFNFIFPNVGVGVYDVAIQAAVDSNATVGGSGLAIGGAAFGLGAVTVESVRLVHDFSF